MDYRPCNLCQATSYELIRAYPGFEGVDLVKCSSCNLMQAQPTPSDEFLLNFYQTSFGNDPVCGFQMPDKSERGFRRRAEHQLNFVEKTLAPGEVARSAGKSVLDVGCHAASFLSLFKKRGWAVTGIDPNPRSSYADTWYGIRVIQKLFEKGMFPPNCFDAVLHSHALEHVPDPKGVLAEFFRVLKPGGWVFIEVPNESGHKVATAKVIPHLYFFTPDTLARLGREAGFEVVTTRVLDIGPRKGSIFSEEGKRWLRLRWRARYDARGGANFFTLLPFFGRVFNEDRYFKNVDSDAVMLRIFLRKPGHCNVGDNPAGLQ